ncbi:hypothetical protein J2847_002990 [Azospirillum agricola]|uniref:hypothetical protein n=1 Tax=Azospirillum agricola TaxID=1720247 RepID=UPI001AE72486|nr:hypothetical protein [Azospirillum agricola]MBP2229691.1 hypothetical protein [Azospirillum agricola]
MQPLKRVYESATEMIDDTTAEAVATNIPQQMLSEVAPQLLAAVRAAQGRPLPCAEGTGTVQ